jgi:hypothetical protein
MRSRLVQESMKGFILAKHRLSLLMLIRFILGVSSRVQGSKVLGSEVSGFKCPISGCCPISSNI